MLRTWDRDTYYTDILYVWLIYVTHYIWQSTSTLLSQRSEVSPDLVPIAAVRPSRKVEPPSWARQGSNTVGVYCLGKIGRAGPGRGRGEGDQLRGGEVR